MNATGASAGESARERVRLFVGLRTYFEARDERRFNLDFALTTGPIPKSEADLGVCGAYRAEESQRHFEHDGAANPERCEELGMGT